MNKLPYIFFGSEPIGPIALKALTLAEYPPVKVIDDPKMTLEDMLAIVEEYKPTFFLVVGFGAILKQAILDTVAGQVLNIHPSMLPTYRGPAPVVQAILDGATETGVSLMEIDKKMDHGPILAQERLMLTGQETPEELYRILTHKGVSLFLEYIDDYLNEELDLLPQDHSEATITHFIKKEDGILDLSKPVIELERQIRAFQGWPRSWIIYKGKRLIIDKAHISNNRLVPDLVQLEGAKQLTFEQFCNGERIKPEIFCDTFLDI